MSDELNGNVFQSAHIGHEFATAEHASTAFSFGVCVSSVNTTVDMRKPTPPSESFTCYFTTMQPSKRQNGKFRFYFFVLFWPKIEKILNLHINSVSVAGIWSN